MKTITIDWFGFVPKLKNPIGDSEYALDIVRNSLRYHLGNDLYNGILDCDRWEHIRGKQTYRNGFMQQERGIFVYYGGQPTISVQFSGQGCKFLESTEQMQPLLQQCGSMANRFDVAIDLIGNVMPDDIVKTLGNKRIKSKVHRESGSGITHEVGSRTSDRFCRVYRYNEPHPRSDRTRIEYELKKKQARIAIAYALAYDIRYVAAQLQQIYKWGHEDMQEFNQAVTPLATERISKSDSKTMSWLLKQCAPAFKRLCESGSISDPVLFLETYFLPRKDDDNGQESE